MTKNFLKYYLLNILQSFLDAVLYISTYVKKMERRTFLGDLN